MLLPFPSSADEQTFAGFCAGAALARWIEDDFLPHRLPSLSRLLKSAALERIHAVEKRPVAPSMEGES